MADWTESEMSLNLDAAEERTKYDAAARKLVAQKAVLAYILKITLDEFADVPVKKIVEEYIEGMPQIHEAAVHQDQPDGKLRKRERK